MEPLKPPQSRELRLHSGDTNDLESIALGIHNGSTQDLLKGVQALELTIEYERAKAARSLSTLMADRLMVNGGLWATDIKEVLEDFLDNEGLIEELIIDDAA